MTAITIDRMRSKLHDLDHIHEALQRSEPLAGHTFSVNQDVDFHLERGWQHGVEAKAGTAPVDATIRLGRAPAAQEYRLTKDALLEATTICGLPKGYALRCPAELLQDALIYWFREGLVNRTGAREYQLLVAAGTAAAITRASVTPFSNLRLLDEVLAGVRERFGACEVLADYKFSHSLRRTHLRLIVPEQHRTIERTGESDDTWSVGIQLRNSLTGEDRTSIDGYLFRWVCTNGQIDTQATSGVWSRRGGGTDREVYEWARKAVDDVLGGLEPALDAIQRAADTPIRGQVSEFLRDVFEHYRVPLGDRARIIENLATVGGPLSMYQVIAAITSTANDADLDPARVEELLRVGGDLPHALAARCSADTPCGRLMH